MDRRMRPDVIDVCATSFNDDRRRKRELVAHEVKKRVAITSPPSGVTELFKKLGLPASTPAIKTSMLEDVQRTLSREQCFPRH